jgi:drug/metabolite transporter (DMT)-like permease
VLEHARVRPLVALLPRLIAVPPDRRPVDTLALGLMVALCALWGFNQVAVKAAAPDISTGLQGALRSAIGLVCLVAWATARRTPFASRETLASGLVAGTLFASEFAFLYVGLSHTTASRMVVFLYLAPVVTALGLALFVPGERLAATQWAGVTLAFAGVAFAFRSGWTGAVGSTWLGDLFGVIAAVLWGATTVFIRASALARASATKTLFYQLLVATATLPLVSLAVGEPGVTRWSPIAIASLLYQGVIVTFASYLTWFWLLTRYLAGRLAVFSFLTPLFGVAFGVLLLDDPLTPSFLLAAAMVAGGILLVNLRSAPRPAAIPARR